MGITLLSSWASVQLWATRITPVSILQSFLATTIDNTDLASSHFTLCEKKLTLGVCVCVSTPWRYCLVNWRLRWRLSTNGRLLKLRSNIYTATHYFLKDNNHDFELFLDALVIGQHAQIPRVVHICKRCARVVLQQRKMKRFCKQMRERATDLCHPTLVSCEVFQQLNTRKASLEWKTCLRCARCSSWLSSARWACGIGLTPVHHWLPWLPRCIWQPVQADVQHETTGVNSANSQVIGLRYNLQGPFSAAIGHLGQHLVDKAKGSVSRVMSKFLVIPNYTLHATSCASHVYCSFTNCGKRSAWCTLKATIPYQLFFVHIAFCKLSGIARQLTPSIPTKHPCGLKKADQKAKTNVLCHCFFG